MLTTINHRAVPGSERGRDLDEERERRLFVRYRRFGDLSARTQLIERFLPLARHLAQRYRREHESVDDLVQVASMGLVKAVDRFDPGRGVAFSSFAVPTILGELKRYFRDAGWAMRVPRNTQERVLAVNEAGARLAKRLGRSPTTAEIAEASGLAATQVTEALEAANATRIGTLERRDDAEGGESNRHWRAIGAEDERYALVEDRDAVARGLVGVSERDRMILKLRFFDELTQSQIAERVGISQMQVSRVLRATLRRIRDTAFESPSDPAGEAGSTPADGHSTSASAVV